MPHIQIDHSPNPEARLDIAGLCRSIRDAAAATGLLPRAGIRARATACTHVAIADGNPDQACHDISLCLRAGRALADRERATPQIRAAVEGYCAAARAKSLLALRFEMREIDAALSPKASSIRRYLPEEGT